MKIDLKNYAWAAHKKKKMKQWDTHPHFSPKKSEESSQDLLKVLQDEIAEKQVSLFATKKQSLLVILQGVDASGKDSLIKHVFNGLNPMGFEAHSFGVPTEAELDHDFIWRTHLKMPARGKIGVFNRSYYEELIMPFIHPELLKSSRIPQEFVTKKILSERASDIISFEKFMLRQGMSIIKIFLHLSKDEQKRRLLERLKDPKKNWKFTDSDLRERRHWKEYQEAYEECFKTTDHRGCPWSIVPADDKPAARLIVATLISKRLDEMKIPDPTLSAAGKERIQSALRSIEKN